MAQQLAYPLINGVKHGFSSVEMKALGQTFIGTKGINYSRTRDRAKVWGTHPDPIGKTRGQNDYDADIELYFAEFMLFIALLKGGKLADGYGDVPFSFTVTYGENGFDTVTDEIIGCTLDTTEVGLTQGTDALTRKFSLNPLKIKFAGIDDLEFPLTPPTGQ